MNQTEFFKRLGAPLKNSRWSWGAVSSDGTVFLRVWQDGWKKHDGSQYVHVNDVPEHEDDPENLGQKERLRHLELIRAGSKSYMIMCRALDTTAPKRVAKSFNDREVFVGGRLIEFANDLWLECVDRVPANSIITR